jgi:hypothetical protein
VIRQAAAHLRLQQVGRPADAEVMHHIGADSRYGGFHRMGSRKAALPPGQEANFHPPATLSTVDCAALCRAPGWFECDHAHAMSPSPQGVRKLPCPTLEAAALRIEVLENQCNVHAFFMQFSRRAFGGNHFG